MLDVLRERRSVRQYDARDIEPELIEQLKEAVLRAPSSRGLHPWRFVFVTDSLLLDELSHSKTHGATFVADARLAVAICADEGTSDVWIEDCAIAGIILQLAATSLGLGSCWVQIRNRTDSGGRSSEERVCEILGLEDGLRVDSVISLGYPARDLPSTPSTELHWNQIVELPAKQS